MNQQSDMEEVEWEWQEMERRLAASAARIEALTEAGRLVVDRYTDRFNAANGRLFGPIDDAIDDLSAALDAAPRSDEVKP